MWDLEQVDFEMSYHFLCCATKCRGPGKLSTIFTISHVLIYAVCHNTISDNYVQHKITLTHNLLHSNTQGWHNKNISQILCNPVQYATLTVSVLFFEFVSGWLFLLEVWRAVVVVSIRHSKCNILSLDGEHALILIMFCFRWGEMHRDLQEFNAHF